MSLLVQHRIFSEVVPAKWVWFKLQTNPRKPQQSPGKHWGNYWQGCLHIRFPHCDALIWRFVHSCRFNAEASLFPSSAVREPLKTVLPNCCCLINGRSMPALHPGCARKERQSKKGTGEFTESLECSGFVQVVMICQMLLNFFTGLQKKKLLKFFFLLSLLPHT